MSCGNEDTMPKYELLGELRILAIVASAPEVNPGDPVTFTPILSDMNGQGRSIDYSIKACIDPGISIGEDPVCTNPDPASIQTGTLAIPANASLTYTGPIASFTLTMPDAGVIFAGRSVVDQHNGVIYLVQYDISVPNGPAIRSFLRIMVSSTSKMPKNQNPSITSIDQGETPVLDSIPLPGASVDFRVTSPAGSSETYQIMNRDGTMTTRTEDLINTWFISDGTIDFSRTIGNSTNTWNPPDARPVNRGLVFLVVTRDGRGGAAFKKFEMY